MLSQEEKWLLKEKYFGEKSEAFFADCQKLKHNTPLAYLIGHTPFLNTKIYLDSKPLIPRSETEYWVEKALSEINTCHKHKNETIEVLDLCTGSGCIGIAILKNCPNIQIDFIELDERHKTTIEKNCSANNLNPMRYKIIVGDLFSPLQSERYDFILSNPPYIDPILDRTEKSVKEYEPALALYGGEAGMELLEKIITEAPKYLNPKGQLWLEHEPEQVKTLVKIADSRFSIITHNDQYGVPRFSQLVLK